MPPVDSSTFHQSLSWAIAATTGNLTVTVDIASPSATWLQVQVLTYSGVSSPPFDGSLSQTMPESADAAVITNPILTTSRDQRIVSYVVGHTGFISVDSEILRSGISGDLVEELAAPDPGSYPVTFNFGGAGNWTILAVGLR